VAAQAIAHTHGHLLGDGSHGLDFAMTGLTCNAAIHMGAVVEIDVIMRPQGMGFPDW
jgi:hypothetical protein